MSQNSHSSLHAFASSDPRLEGVLQIAREAHEGQFREDGRTPYIEHPKLASEILDYFGRADFLLAMEIQPSGRLDEKQRVTFGPLLTAVGLADATAIDEEAYQRIKQLLKAVLLLHDAVEDNKTYRAKPQLLREKLSQTIERTWPPRSANESQAVKLWANHVFDCVMELTDGAYRYDGNVTWQLDAKPLEKQYDKRPRQIAHVQKIRPESRLAKMLDQNATVLADLMHTDLSAFLKPRKENTEALETAMKKLSKDKGFMHKALDVSRACRGHNHRHPYHEFFKRTADYFEKNCNLAQDGKFAEYEARRKKFKIGHAVIATRNASEFPERRKQIATPEALSFINPNYERLETGLKRITIACKTGKVLSYSVIVSPQHGGSPANEIAHTLCVGLESIRLSHVDTHDVEGQHIKAKGLEEQADVCPAQEFTLNPPVDFYQF